MSISISGSDYLNMLGSTGSISGGKVQGLEDALNQTDTDKSTDKELMDVCKNFESYFVQKVFEEMKKTVHSSDEENSYVQYLGDIYTQGIADEVTESGGVGIAKVLYESMKKNSGNKL